MLELNNKPITSEPFYMDVGLRELPTQLGIDNDDKIVGLLKLTDIIHQHEAKAIAYENRGAAPQSMERVIQILTDAARS